MRAGLTVAAILSAAVVSMAVLRLLRGSVLEENTARTTASARRSWDGVSTFAAYGQLIE